MNMRWQPPKHGAPAGRRFSGEQILAWLTAAVMVVGTALGGATRYNLAPIMIIETACLPLLAYTLWRMTAAPLPKDFRLPLILIGAAFAILIIQLIPLPGPIWAVLPGHGPAAAVRRMAGVTGWAPISLLPSETLSHLLALLPPVAVFLGVAGLSTNSKRWLSLVPLGMSLVSVAIGVAQIAGGPDSPLYFVEGANTDSAVGLFVNRNHQASMLVAALPLAALWLNLDRHQRRKTLIPVAFAIAIFMVEIVALVVVKSRAGVLLTVPALVASLMLVWRNEMGEGRRGATLLGGVIAIVLLVAVAFGIGPVLDRFTSANDTEMGGRLTAALSTLHTTLEYLPFGSGSGTFVPVFAGHEPIDLMGPKFWNHAHNDFLEIFLETGLMGLAALVGFLYWVARRTLVAWASPSSNSANLACAGSIVVILLLLHSTIDYPLRTLTMATVFAYACGLLVNPGGEARRSRRSS